MKTALIICVLSASIFTASSVMAECPTELPMNELVDCIALEEHEPDITDLMAEAAAKGNTSALQLVKTESDTGSSHN